MKLQVVGLGDVKHADQIDRILLEDPVIDNIEPIAIDLEISELSVPTPETGQAQYRLRLAQGLLLHSR